MTAQVWMSSLFSNYDIGMKQGLRTKYRDHDWTPASFVIPTEPDEVYRAQRRYHEGFALERRDLPEAGAVWNKGRFSKTGEIIMVGPFYAVKGRLFDIFSRHDLGEGGLVPVPNLQSDLQTAYSNDYYILQFGCRKDTFLESASKNVKFMVTDKVTGMDITAVHSWSEDLDVALAPSALTGPELWCEERVDNKLFLSDALARELITEGMADTFRLQKCRIEGEGA